MVAHFEISRLNYKMDDITFTSLEVRNAAKRNYSKTSSWPREGGITAPQETYFVNPNRMYVPKAVSITVIIKR